jgi:hypothetical protein
MPAPIRRRDYQVVGKTDFGQEIRIFDNASIQREINEVLAAAPDDKRSGVILAGDLKSKKVTAHLYGKIPIAGGKFVWTYGGTLAYDYGEKDWAAKAHAAIWF